MNKTASKLRWIFSILAGATLFGADVSQGQTITTTYENSFNTAAQAVSWNYWYDLPQSSGSPQIGWDAAVNNTAGQPTSGSLPYFINWPGTGAAGQMQIYGTFAETGQYDLSQSIDPTSTTAFPLTFVQTQVVPQMPTAISVCCPWACSTITVSTPSQT